MTLNRMALTVCFLLLAGLSYAGRINGSAVFDVNHHARSVAVDGDMSALAINPAGLATCPLMNIQINMADRIEDSWSESLAIVRPLNPADIIRDGALAIAIDAYQGGAFHYMTFNEMTDEITGDRQLSAENDYQLTAALAMPLFDFYGSFYGGVALKGIYSVLVETYDAFTLAADIGVLYKPAWLPVKHAGIGLAVSNLGLPMVYREDAEALPLKWSVGINYPVAFSSGRIFNLAADYVSENGKKPIGVVSVDARLWKNFNARIGHFINHDNRFITAGVAVKVYQIRVEYNFTFMKTFGYEQKIGLAFELMNNRGMK